MQDLSSVKKGLPDPAEELEGVYTGLDPSQRPDKIMLANCLVGEDAKIKDFDGKEVAVINYVLHRIDLADQTTGEVKPSLRLVLIAHDASRYSCGSDGVLNALRGLIAAFGPAPWLEPIRIKPRSGKSRGGRNYLSFDIVG